MRSCDLRFKQLAFFGTYYLNSNSLCIVNKSLPTCVGVQLLSGYVPKKKTNQGSSVLRLGKLNNNMKIHLRFQNPFIF